MTAHTTPFQSFLHCTSLSVLAMLAMSCYILADTFFIARGMGAQGLAALNIAIPAYNLIYGTGLMAGVGGATCFSILCGRGEKKGANIMFTHSLYLGIGASLLFFLAGLFLSQPITRLLGADAAVFQMAHTYLSVLLLFSPAFILNAILLCYVRNDGKPRLAMLATAGGSLANIILDYIFIFPCGMGIFGAILATGLAPVIGILIMSPHLLSPQRGFCLAPARPSLRPILKSLSLGFPSLLIQVSSGIVMVLFNHIILGLEGNTGIAAYGVVANLSLVVISVYTGIAQGIQPLVSSAFGRRDMRSAALYLRYGLTLMLLLAFLIYSAILLFASPIAGAFNSGSDRHLQELAAGGLRLYFTSTAFVGFNIILSMYFTSVDRPLPAHLLSMLRGLLLIIPAALLLSSLWGMTGVWLCVPFTELATAVWGGFYMLFRFNKKTGLRV